MKKVKKPGILSIRILNPILFTLALITATTLIYLYGRGFRLDFTQRTVEPKGMLVANSQPNGAQVFINDKLTSATNTTITLDPGWYSVRLTKEGYSTWEKRLRVQGEVVAKTDAILFPINPSLSPITVSGITNPKLTLETNKIVFNITKDSDFKDAVDDSGVYLLDLSDRPLGATRNTRQIAKNYPVNFENATYIFDPTGKKLLANIGSRYYLLETDLLNTNPPEVTSILTQIKEEWDKDGETLQAERLKAVKPELSNVLNSSIKTISWSPDETKILYEATASATIPQIIKPALIGTNPTFEQRNIKPDQIYVYDIKEDKNFFIIDKKDLPTPTPTPVPVKTLKTTPTPTPFAIFAGYDQIFPLIWFPTSSHILVTENNKISVMDYDATNKITLYAGPFTGDLVAPWPNGSKIVILTTLNPQTGGLPNLYALNIR